VGRPSEVKTGLLWRIPSAVISEPGVRSLQKKINSYKASLNSANATVSRSSSCAQVMVLSAKALKASCEATLVRVVAIVSYVAFI
jgi:hypothetical protein